MNDEVEEKGTRRTEQTGSEAAADQSDAMKGQEPLPTVKPSQAEGDRETVEQDLYEKEEGGQLS